MLAIHARRAALHALRNKSAARRPRLPGALAVRSATGITATSAAFTDGNGSIPYLDTASRWGGLKNKRLRIDGQCRAGCVHQRQIVSTILGLAAGPAKAAGRRAGAITTWIYIGCAVVGIGHAGCVAVQIQKNFLLLAGKLQQLGLRRDPRGPDDVFPITRQRHCGQYADDSHHDHQLEQREAPGVQTFHKPTPN